MLCIVVCYFQNYPIPGSKKPKERKCAFNPDEFGFIKVNAQKIEDYYLDYVREEKEARNSPTTMLTSTNPSNQYLRPEYLSPLPSTVRHSPSITLLFDDFNTLIRS